MTLIFFLKKKDRMCLYDKNECAKKKIKKAYVNFYTFIENSVDFYKGDGQNNYFDKSENNNFNLRKMALET
jgi:hypothetical protein